MPEICWIEDFNRKYFRPNNIYGDNGYLKRLANGKKTHQRKQFETYHEQYMNSEYKTSAGEGSLIQWRSGQPESAKIESGPNAGKYEIKAKVKMYADGYFTAAIASGAGEEAAINIHIRGKKGQEIPFSKVQESNFNDATCYVYSPILYQEFTNIETLYPEYFSAPAATKLRKLSLIPTTGAQKSMLQTSLSFESNVEEVIVKDCINATFELDLTSCNRLKKLDTRGSAFSAYSIADGAPLSEFRINSPTALILSNLRHLTKNVIDEETGEPTGETAFSIDNYGRLRKIEINNIDFNDVSSKDIVNNTV